VVKILIVKEEKIKISYYRLNNMKRKILFLLFLSLSISGISQEKIWTNRLEVQVSSSFTKPDYLYSRGNRPFIDFKNQTSI